jgi:gamma-glutamylcyclotransferase (GGCT)/AIG2-like uncharacterized protein YtfP
MTEHIFLYGTLQPELAPAEIIETVRKLRRVGRGRVRGRLYDIGPHPALILGGEGEVRGAIYELPRDREVLRRLDRYEGCDPRAGRGAFRRARAAVSLEEGGERSAFLYVYARDPGPAPLVPGGDYLAHRAASRGER